MPVFLVIMLGLAIRRAGLIGSSTATQMTNIVFKVAMPVKLFTDVSMSDFSQMLDFMFIAFTAGSVIVFFLICFLIAEKFIQDTKKKGAFVQGSFRGNYVILGATLIPAILGYTPALAATAVIITVTLFNVLSVIALTINGDRGQEQKSALVSILRSIATNPLIIGIFFGILYSLAPFRMPLVLDSSVNIVSALASPLALIVIGANLDFTSLKERFKLSLVAGFLKLIVMPLMFLPLAIWLGMSSEAIIVLFVLYCAPTAIVSYVMAASMGSDEHLAANIILVTSMISIFTYTIGVFILRAINII